MIVVAVADVAAFVVVVVIVVFVMRRRMDDITFHAIVVNHFNSAHCYVELLILCVWLLCIWMVDDWVLHQFVVISWQLIQSFNQSIVYSCHSLLLTNYQSTQLLVSLSLSTIFSLSLFIPSLIITAHHHHHPITHHHRRPITHHHPIIITIIHHLSPITIIR